MIIRSITLLIIAVSLLLATASVLAGLPETLEKVRGSIVAVGTLTPVRHPNAKKPQAKFSGTGFVVGNGRQIITNHHVVPKSLDRENGESLAIFTGRGESAKGHIAKVVRTDPEHDLALLEISGVALSGMELDGVSPVREGEEMAFTGFPLGMVLGIYPATNKGIVSAITPVVMPARTARNLTPQQIQRLKTPFEIYQLDAISYPGFSGSPLYNIATGKVVGVLNSVFVKDTKESLLSSPSGITYAIPVKYVHELLKTRK